MVVVAEVLELDGVVVVVVERRTAAGTDEQAASRPAQVRVVRTPERLWRIPSVLLIGASSNIDSW